ncbi:hypothetical protein [Halapricum hydrolyticum]|uniref:Uncharacterized protein n=1 Tax=Halapricum hydrolyticum TaxID=2979991 RepID=A0AAE3IC67_9EURY|nr:hypothetical protein [Halapricum hydrolyticum]MCU4719001.1 hypothetical protein [Halapricum hydrolyticum]MCU4727930.1 hypothetical protein [Halapricum hydrolyticum]
MNRRWAYGALLALAVLLLLGTGGFSAISADRGVSVTVAGDDEAYVGYNATCHGQTLEITITNQFDSDITGTVTVGDTGAEFDTLASGEAVTTEFINVESEDPVTVTAEGDGVSAELDRSVPTECTMPNDRVVTFPGDSGGALVDVADASGTYWTPGGQQDFTADSVNGNQLKDSDGPITAVYVDSTNTTYKKCDNGDGPATASGSVNPDEIECS